MKIKKSFGFDVDFYPGAIFVSPIMNFQNSWRNF